MKKIVVSDSESIKKEKKIEKALRTVGYLFPETVSEVKEFESLFGTTQMILPEELFDPDFLNNYSDSAQISTDRRSKTSNFALAAREGSKKLPNDLLKRMEMDRRKADAKKKGK